jgi:hypothetical protein
MDDLCRAAIERAHEDCLRAARLTARNHHMECSHALAGMAGEIEGWLRYSQVTAAARAEMERQQLSLMQDLPF